eukprot:GFYU01001779.1.p1 GENE.GFYU01001779.1~~GFYU01001779.1.p1  ORF type:complete len:2128 (-),score=830.53 GFYU01001779.1:79-6462(-)
MVGDGNDITIVAGTDINLTPGTSVLVASGKNVALGAAGQYLVGDGTNVEVVSGAATTIKSVSGTTITSAAEGSGGGGATIATYDANTNTTLTALTIKRGVNSTTTGAATLGAAIDFQLENGTDATYTSAGSISAYWDGAVDVGALSFKTGPQGAPVELLSLHQDQAKLKLKTSVLQGAKLSFNSGTNENEYIYSDGTDLGIGSTNDILLTATTGVKIPASVKLSFDGDTTNTEAISAAGNDLTLDAAADIHLAATNHVTIPSGKSLSFNGTNASGPAITSSDGAVLGVSGTILTATASTGALNLVSTAAGVTINSVSGLTVTSNTDTNTVGGGATIESVVAAGTVAVNAVNPMFTLKSYHTGTVAQGSGASIVVQGENSGGNMATLGSLEYRWNNGATDESALDVKGGTSGTGTLATLSNAGVTLNVVDNTNNGDLNALTLTRTVTTGGGANGLQNSLLFVSETATDTTNHNAAVMTAELTDATAATLTSKLTFSTYQSTTKTDILELTNSVEPKKDILMAASGDGAKVKSAGGGYYSFASDSSANLDISGNRIDLVPTGTYVTVPANKKIAFDGNGTDGSETISGDGTNITIAATQAASKINVQAGTNGIELGPVDDTTAGGAVVAKIIDAVANGNGASALSVRHGATGNGQNGVGVQMDFQAKGSGGTFVQAGMIGAALSAADNSTGEMTLYAGAAGAIAHITLGTDGSNTGISFDKNIYSDIVLGTDDGVAAVTGKTIRGSNAAGTNVAGADLTISAGLGTGTGTLSTLNFQVPSAQASGATQHGSYTLATMSGSTMTLQGKLQFNAANNNNIIELPNNLSAGLLMQSAATSMLRFDSTTGSENVDLFVPLNMSDVLSLTSDKATTNDALTVATFKRSTSAGNGASGIGAVFSTHLEDTAGNVEEASKEQTVLTVATDGSEQTTLSRFMRTANNVVERETMTHVAGTGLTTTLTSATSETTSIALTDGTDGHTFASSATALVVSRDKGSAADLAINLLAKGNTNNTIVKLAGESGANAHTITSTNTAGPTLEVLSSAALDATLKATSTTASLTVEAAGGASQTSSLVLKDGDNDSYSFISTNATPPTLNMLASAASDISMTGTSSALKVTASAGAGNASVALTSGATGAASVSFTEGTNTLTMTQTATKLTTVATTHELKGLAGPVTASVLASTATNDSTFSLVDVAGNGYTMVSSNDTTNPTLIVTSDHSSAVTFKATTAASTLNILAEAGNSAVFTMKDDDSGYTLTSNNDDTTPTLVLASTAHAVLTMQAGSANANASLTLEANGTGTTTLVMDDDGGSGYTLVSDNAADPSLTLTSSGNASLTLQANTGAAKTSSLSIKSHTNSAATLTLEDDDESYTIQHTMTDDTLTIESSNSAANVALKSNAGATTLQLWANAANANSVIEFRDSDATLTSLTHTNGAITWDIKGDHVISNSGAAHVTSLKANATNSTTTLNLFNDATDGYAVVSSGTTTPTLSVTSSAAADLTLASAAGTNSSAFTMKTGNALATTNTLKMTDSAGANYYQFLHSVASGTPTLALSSDGAATVSVAGTAVTTLTLESAANSNVVVNLQDSAADGYSITSTTLDSPVMTVQAIGAANTDANVVVAANGTGTSSLTVEAGTSAVSNFIMKDNNSSYTFSFDGSTTLSVTGSSSADMQVIATSGTSSVTATGSGTNNSSYILTNATKTTTLQQTGADGAFSITNIVGVTFDGATTDKTVTVQSAADQDATVRLSDGTQYYDMASNGVDGTPVYSVTASHGGEFLFGSASAATAKMTLKANTTNSTATLELTSNAEVYSVIHDASGNSLNIQPTAAAGDVRMIATSGNSNLTIQAEAGATHNSILTFTDGATGYTITSDGAVAPELELQPTTGVNSSVSVRASSGTAQVNIEASSGNTSRLLFGDTTPAISAGGNFYIESNNDDTNPAITIQANPTTAAEAHMNFVHDKIATMVVKSSTAGTVTNYELTDGVKTAAMQFLPSLGDGTIKFLPHSTEGTGVVAFPSIAQFSKIVRWDVAVIATSANANVLLPTTPIVHLNSDATANLALTTGGSFADGDVIIIVCHAATATTTIRHHTDKVWMHGATDWTCATTDIPTAVQGNKTLTLIYDSGNTMWRQIA